MANRVVSELARFHHLDDAGIPSALELEPARGLGDTRSRLAGLGEDVLPGKPLPYRQSAGRRRLDVLYCSSFLPLILSARAAAALEAGGFSGYLTREVAIKLKDGTSIDDYVALCVTGRCGELDESLSEKIMIPPYEDGGIEVPGVRGVLFRPESWDGSDVFVPDGSSMVMVSDAARAALERAELTNLSLQRITEKEHISYEQD